MRRSSRLAIALGIFGCCSTGAIEGTHAAARGHDDDGGGRRVEHVLLISLDGFHDFDLDNYVAAHPHSALASLVERGVKYTNATTSSPSDSFPGTLAMVTGGSPASTGVYYDVSWDNDLSPAGSSCTTRGAVVSYNETINVANVRDTTIEPTKLPLNPDDGCTQVYPHQYLKVNT